MIEVLVTLVPSLCWLLLRCYRLLQTPPEKLARQLHVEIPPAPVICVDELGRNHVTFHWDEPALPSDNVFYAVMVNGSDVGTLARKSVKLCDLAPDTLYSIQVLAVNVITNFISQSAAVYVQTGGSSVSGAISRRAPAKNIELARIPRASELRKNAPDTKALLSPETTAADVLQIASEAKLTAYLCVLQEELKKTTRDHENISAAQTEEEGRLQAKIAAYKKELGEGLTFRAKKDHDLKELERQKDTLAFEKTKLMKQLKNHQLHKNMQLSKLADLQTRVGKLTERKNHVLHTEKLEQDKKAQSVDALTAEISASRSAAAQIDESTKALAAEKRNLTSVVALLRPVVQQLTALPSVSVSSEDVAALGSSPGPTGDVFTREGTLTKAGAHYMQEVYSLRPEWQGDLSREIELVGALEASWKDTFREAINRYLTLFHSLEAARFYADELYEQQRLTEHQASVHFGGYGLALPKPGHKKMPHLVVTDGPYSDSSGPGSVPASGPLSGPTSPPPDLPAKDIYSVSLDPQNHYEVPTPQLGNALVVALHPTNSNAAFGMQDYASAYDVHPLASPNTSFGEQDLQQQQQHTIDPSSNWLNHQTYPALSQGQYSNMNFDQQMYSGTGYSPASAPQVSLSQPHPGLGLSIGRSVSPGIGQNISQNLAQSMSQSMSQGMSQGMSRNIDHAMTQNLAQSMARPLSPAVSNNLQPTYLGDFQDQQIYTPELQHSIPATTMGHYPSGLRPNYAYNDSLYQQSPVLENAYLHTPIPATTGGLANTLWNNNSQASFVDSRRPFQDYTLQGQTASEPLNPSVSHNSNLSTDSALLNSIMLPSASHYSTTNNIWLDRYVGGNQGHNRTVSSGSHLSHLWRSEANRQDKSPSNGFVSEFLPFSLNTLPSQHGNSGSSDGRDRTTEADYDIRLL